MNNTVVPTNPTQIIECVLHGRIGNIILSIFSVYYFCIKNNIPVKNIKISSTYDFINMTGKCVDRNYMKNINMLFDNNIIQLVDQTELFRRKEKAKAFGKHIALSFNANMTAFNIFDHISMTTLKNIDYIEFNYFDVTYNNSKFYQNDFIASQLFRLLFLKYELFDQYIKNIRQNTLGYSIRRGDFLSLTPQCIYTNEQIINELIAYHDKYNPETILIFSDDIKYCKKLLVNYINRYNIKFYNRQNDYIDLIMLSLCKFVEGNRFSTFVQCAKIINSLYFNK